MNRALLPAVRDGPFQTRGLKLRLTGLAVCTPACWRGGFSGLLTRSLLRVIRVGSNGVRQLPVYPWSDILRIGRHASKVPHPDSCTAAIAPLFNYPVSEQNKTVGNTYPEGVRGFHVENQLELSGLLNR